MMLKLPRAVEFEVVMVNVEFPALVRVLGDKFAVTPAGRPLALRFTTSLNAPDEVTAAVKVTLLPALIEVEVGDNEIEKSGLVGACTVRLTRVLCVNEPPVPETVIV